MKKKKKHGHGRAQVKMSQARTSKRSMNSLMAATSPVRYFGCVMLAIVGIAGSVLPVRLGAAAVL